MKDVATIVLAAGKGTRMKSATAKVLHPLCGQPLIHYPLQLAADLGSSRTVVVVGHQREDVESAVGGAGFQNVQFAHQEQQLGTGHAVMSALPALKGTEGPLLILYGDVPLLQKNTVARLAKEWRRVKGPLAFIAFRPADPTGYGRVIETDGQVCAIVEHRDCTPAQRRIGLVNSGIYLMDAAFARRSLQKLKSANAQGEFYLTDLVAIAAQKSQVAIVEAEPDEVTGVNDRVDLAHLAAVQQRRIVQQWMRAGVTVERPETVTIEAHCRIGEDTVLGPMVRLLGNTRIGRGCTIEAGAILRDSTIEDAAVIRAYSVLDEAVVGPMAEVGPMARLRPGAVLKKKAKVGNWVELKKTVMGEGAKANHLAYLGDGLIGDNVNLGAGCIFCNYDGFLKHQTVIGDNVFVGSDSQLVAPVTVGEGAYVASGTTVVSDVPAGALAISRVRQTNKEGYGSLLKERLKAEKERQKKDAQKK